MQLCYKYLQCLVWWIIRTFVKTANKQTIIFDSAMKKYLAKCIYTNNLLHLNFFNHASVY